MQRLVAALKPYHPRTILNGGNFTLLTDAGPVDLLAHIDGFQNYADVKASSQSIDAFGWEIAVLSIDGLIRAKRAAARPKDLLAIPELEVLKEAEGKKGAT